MNLLAYGLGALTAMFGMLVLLAAALMIASWSVGGKLPDLTITPEGVRDLINYFANYACPPSSPVVYPAYMGGP